MTIVTAITTTFPAIRSGWTKAQQDRDAEVECALPWRAGYRKFQPLQDTDEERLLSRKKGTSKHCGASQSRRPPETQPQCELGTRISTLIKTGAFCAAAVGRSRACAGRAGLTRSSRKRAPGKAFGGFFHAVLLTQKLSSNSEASFLFGRSFLFVDVFLCDRVVELF